MNTPHAIRPTLLLVGLVAIVSLAACAGAGGPVASPSSSARPVPTQAAGGGTSGDPGTGVGGPVDPAPVDPGLGGGRLVIAKPGQLNPRPVAPTLLEPLVDGRRVIVKVTWVSGVEPCNVLDSVKIDRTGSDIVLTVIEGSSDLDAACIEIAEQKSTIVDLGELEPGQYTISAPGGEAKPVTVTVAQ